MKLRLENAGHSLVELMIALALSLYLMSGLLQSLLANKQAFFLIADEARINNNGLYALEVLEQHIERAGYRNRVSDVDTVAARATDFPANDQFVAAAVVSGENNVSDDHSVKAGSDVLHVRYQSAIDGGFKDCRGANLQRGHGTVTMSFYVDHDNQLRCRGRENAGGTRPSAVLLEGVSQFQVLYRVQRSSLEDAGAQGYVNADQMDALGAAAWQRITALKIALITVRSAKQNREDEQAVQLLDADINVPAAKLAWKKFEAVFALENVSEFSDDW